VRCLLLMSEPFNENHVSGSSTFGSRCIPPSTADPPGALVERLHGFRHGSSFLVSLEFQERTRSRACRRALRGPSNAVEACAQPSPCAER